MQNSDKSFIGSYVLGKGFVISPEKAHALIEKDSKNRDVLFPYLIGKDLNSQPDQSPSRWIINFFDWPIEKAKEYGFIFKYDKFLSPNTYEDPGEYLLFIRFEENQFSKSKGVAPCGKSTISPSGVMT